MHKWSYCRLASSQAGEIVAAATLQHVTVDSERPADGVQCNAVSLAKKALLASKQAASKDVDLKSIKADDDDSLPFGLVLSYWPTLNPYYIFPFYRLICLECKA